jgi:hypothetical protein
MQPPAGSAAAGMEAGLAVVAGTVVADCTVAAGRGAAQATRPRCTGPRRPPGLREVHPDLPLGPPRAAPFTVHMAGAWRLIGRQAQRRDPALGEPVRGLAAPGPSIVLEVQV